jgi:hypothetical protein
VTLEDLFFSLTEGTPVGGDPGAKVPAAPEPAGVG